MNPFGHHSLGLPENGHDLGLHGSMGVFIIAAELRTEQKCISLTQNSLYGIRRGGKREPRVFPSCSCAVPKVTVNCSMVKALLQLWSGFRQWKRKSVEG